MSHIFNQLTEEEISKVKDAIPQITILIAGADGNIEAKERAWAEKITGIRTYAEPEEYRSFYESVGENFQTKLDDLLTQLSKDTSERSKQISGKLAELNPILAKLPVEIGARLYVEFKKFASHVAKSSGGFLGFFTVDSEEAKYVNLPMLTPIEYEPGSDEEE